MPYVEVDLNKNKCLALLDTGASVSLVSEDILNSETTNLTTYKKTVVDASGNRIPIIGEVEIKIITPKGTFHENLLVYSANSALKIKIILGMNILRQANMDFPNGEIKFKGTIKESKNNNTDSLILIIKSQKIHNGSTNVRVSVVENDNKSTKEFERELKKLKQENEAITNKLACMNTSLEKLSREISESLKCINELNVLKNMTEVNEQIKEIQDENEKELNEIPIHLLDEIVLNENSVNVMHIRLSERKFKSTDSVVVHSTEHKQGIVVANAVTKISKGKIIVNIININDRQITLKQGTRLCKCTSI